MVSPESMHTSNITQTEKVIVRNMYACTYKYIATTINEKRSHEFKRESEEGFGGRKGEEGMM